VKKITRFTIGDKIGSVTINNCLNKDIETKQYWDCICDCGKHVKYTTSYLKKCVKNNTNVSCGCKRNYDKKKKNKYEIINEQITHVYYNDNDFFIIDTDCINKIKKYYWNVNPFTGYIYTQIGNRKNRKHLCLHRLLMDCKDSQKDIDHINRNKLDNRLLNMRICDHKDNCKNSSIRSDNTSGVRGVSFNKGHNKWKAEINANKHYYFLGYFDRFEDAVEARKQGEIKYHKAYAAILN
jgi:hypothetical protein